MKPKKVDLGVPAHVAYLWLQEGAPVSVAVLTPWGTVTRMTVVRGLVEWSAS